MVTTLSLMVVARTSSSAAMVLISSIFLVTNHSRRRPSTRSSTLMQVRVMPSSSLMRLLVINEDPTCHCRHQEGAEAIVER